jgi:hypothetical protein
MLSTADVVFIILSSDFGNLRHNLLLYQMAENDAQQSLSRDVLAASSILVDALESL